MHTYLDIYTIYIHYIFYSLYILHVYICVCTLIYRNKFIGINLKSGSNIYVAKMNTIFIYIFVLLTKQP